MRQKRKTDHEKMADALRQALQPATERALTKEEAYRLIYISARSMRQGVSIDYLIPALLDEMFGPEELLGFTETSP